MGYLVVLWLLFSYGNFRVCLARMDVGDWSHWVALLFWVAVGPLPAAVVVVGICLEPLFQRLWPLSTRYVGFRG